MWQRRLFANVRELMVPAAAREALGTNFLSVKRIVDWLLRARWPLRRGPDGGP